MVQKVLIVLGAPNSPNGELSDISKSRLNHCVHSFKKGNLVICTGGWGNHFNTSEFSHAFFAKNYLVKNGIPEEAFLDFALSSNTVDDAVKVKAIIQNLKALNLVIITSDYHIERVKLIFDEILSIYPIEYIRVKSNFSNQKLDILVQHEKLAIKAIKENGLYY